MKKTLLIGILLLAAYAVNAQFQKPVAKYVTYNLEAGDTIHITKADKIVAISCSVPISATDSVYVFGDTQGFLGMAPEQITYGPGESFSIGYNDQVRINNLTIIAGTRARLILMPVKE
jgi:hypothetical protein